MFDYRHLADLHLVGKPYIESPAITGANFVQISVAQMPDINPEVHLILVQIAKTTESRGLLLN